MKTLGIIICLFSYISLSQSLKFQLNAVSVKQIWDEIKKPPNIPFDTHALMNSDRKQAAIYMSCYICQVVVQKIHDLSENNEFVNPIITTLTMECYELGPIAGVICQGISFLVLKELVNVLKKVTVNPEHACNFVFVDVCSKAKDPRHNWKVGLPAPVRSENLLTQAPSNDVPKLKVLQIGDINYDPDYKENSEADCDLHKLKQSLCCRKYSNDRVKSPAGKWGAHKKCDSPKALLDDTFAHIAEQHKDIDYIMWSGDAVSHDIKSQTKEKNEATIADVVGMLNNHFEGIPVYTSVGNHESTPPNNFPPEDSSSDNKASSLYSKLSDLWDKWIPTKLKKSIKDGGFYSTVIRPGLRLIVINTNFCNRFNFWLLEKSKDPNNHLAWLANELLFAEANSEKVHILGHIPPDRYDCIEVWSKNYRDIIKRFKTTVMAQFFGHTNSDEFSIFYDDPDSPTKEPINIGYISPPLTPHENRDPSYRIFHIDGDHPETTRSVLDHETWKMNLDEANRKGRPVWSKAYNALKAYGMKSLLPKDWHDLVTRMSSDENLFQVFYQHFYNRNDGLKAPTCGKDCRDGILNLISGKRSQLWRNIFT